MKWVKALETCLCKENSNLYVGLKTEEGKVMSFAPLPHYLHVILGKYKKSSEFYRDGVVEFTREYGSEIDEMRVVREDKTIALYGKIKGKFYCIEASPQFLPLLLFNCLWRKVPVKVHTNEFSLDLLPLNLNFLEREPTSNIIEDEKFEYLEFKRSEGEVNFNPLLPFLSSQSIKLEWVSPTNDIYLLLSIEMKELIGRFYSPSLFSKLKRKIRNEEGKIFLNVIEEAGKKVREKIYQETQKYGLKISGIKSSLDLIKRKNATIKIPNFILVYG